MKKTIDVTDAVYSRLERLARGFDTPSDVIARLLDSFDAASPSKSVPIETNGIEQSVKDKLDNSDIQMRISRVLSKMSPEKIDLFCDKNYSRDVFGINFPLLIKVPARSDHQTRREAVKQKGVSRWTWKFSFEKNDFIYAICTQWFRWHDNSVRKWLRENEH